MHLTLFCTHFLMTKSLLSGIISILVLSDKKGRKREKEKKEKLRSAQQCNLHLGARLAMQRYHIIWDYNESQAATMTADVWCSQV